MTKKEIKEWEEKFDKIYPKIIRSNMELTEMKLKLALLSLKLNEIETALREIKARNIKPDYLDDWDYLISYPDEENDQSN